MADNKEIIILGAGYAGVHAAKKLAKKYKGDDSVRITLIDKNSYHTMLTELHEVAGARVEPNAVRMDLRRLFNRTKVKLVTANVSKIDYDKNVITTNVGEHRYDYLMIGLGSEPNDFGVPGVKDHGFTLWSWEDSMRIRTHIETIASQASKTHDVKKRREMLTFAVAGSGFTGIEMVGELMEWRNRLAENSKIDPEEIRLLVIEAAPTILNLLDRKSADAAEKYMVKNGVEILKDSQITEVKEDAVILKSGESIPSQTLIWTAGIKANTDIQDQSLAVGRAGRLVVNEYMEAKDIDRVYVVGDQAYFEEEEGKPTPQIVQAAEQTAVCAAKNIIAAISGGEKVAYKGKYDGFMVSIGARWGVANLNGMKLKGWFAIFIKHMVNFYYLFGVRSGYYMWKYAEHEFFYVKDHRQIFRGLLTKYGNVLWTVMLRIFVGGFWLNEVMGKIVGDAWYEVQNGFKEIQSIGAFFGACWNAVVTAFTGIAGPGSWLETQAVRMPFHWLWDVESGATSAATSAATSGATEVATEWATPILYESPAIFDWIMQIMIPNETMALIMQNMVIITQLLIALALITGLFTFLSSAVSVGLILTFLLSAMLGWDSVWVIPASIALMNGSGRTLGLDYYVLPFLKRKLGRLWYGSVKSIYSDVE